MEYVVIITMLALIEYIAFGMRVGAARGQFNVPAPATTGNETFERYFRVHYNTLEQLVVFIPGLWAFGYYVGWLWAAGFGLIYLVGRILYAISYVKEPGSRAAGTLISVLPCWILVLGGLVGAAWQVIST